MTYRLIVAHGSHHSRLGRDFTGTPSEVLSEMEYRVSKWVGRSKSDRAKKVLAIPLGGGLENAIELRVKCWRSRGQGRRVV